MIETKRQCSKTFFLPTGGHAATSTDDRSCSEGKERADERSSVIHRFLKYQDS